MGPPDDRRLQDLGMSQQKPLDFRWKHVETGDLDHVLCPPRDAQVSVRVQRAEVTSPEPAIVEGRGGILRTPIVTRSHVRAGDLDFSLRLRMRPKTVAR